MPKGIRMNQESFLARMKELFGDKYDFSESVFINSDNDVTYFCPKHGKITTKARNLLEGYGCKLCAREEVKKKLTWTQGKFLADTKLTFKRKRMRMLRKRS